MGRMQYICPASSGAAAAAEEADFQIGERAKWVSAGLGDMGVVEAGDIGHQSSAVPAFGDTFSTGEACDNGGASIPGFPLVVTAAGPKEFCNVLVDDGTWNWVPRDELTMCADLPEADCVQTTGR